MPIAHFTAFCTSDKTDAQTAFALEPTNYEATAYYSNNYIYIKSISNYDMSYAFVF